MAQQTKTGVVQHQRVWKRPTLHKRHCDTSNQTYNISNAMTITSVNPLCFRKDDHGFKASSNVHEKDSKVSQRVQKLSCDTKNEASVETSGCDGQYRILLQNVHCNPSHSSNSVEQPYQQNAVPSSQPGTRNISQTLKVPSSVAHAALMPSHQSLPKSSNQVPKADNQGLHVSRTEQVFTSHWGKVADCLNGARVAKNQELKTNHQGLPVSNQVPKPDCQGLPASKPERTFTSHWGKVADCLNGARVAKHQELKTNHQGTHVSNQVKKPDCQGLPVSRPEQVFTSHCDKVADCLNGARVAKNQELKTNHQGIHVSNQVQKPDCQGLSVSRPEQVFTSHWDKVADCINGARVAKNQELKTNHQGMHVSNQVPKSDCQDLPASKAERTFTSHWGKVADCLNGARLAKGGQHHPLPASRNASLRRECSSFKILSVSLVARQAQAMQNPGHKKDTAAAAPNAVSEKLSAFIKADHCATAPEAGQNLKAANAYKYQSKRLSHRGKVEPNNKSVDLKSTEENTKCIEIKQVVFGENQPRSVGKGINCASVKINQRKDLAQECSKHSTILPISSVNNSGQWTNPADTNHLYVHGDKTTTKEHSVGFSYNHTETYYPSGSSNRVDSSQEYSTGAMPDESDLILTNEAANPSTSPSENCIVLPTASGGKEEPDSVPHKQVSTRTDVDDRTSLTSCPDAKQTCAGLPKPATNFTNCENTKEPLGNLLNANNTPENESDTNTISDNGLGTNSVSKNSLDTKSIEENCSDTKSVLDNDLETKCIQENDIEINGISKNDLEAKSFEGNCPVTKSFLENELERKGIPGDDLKTNSSSENGLEAKCVPENMLEANETPQNNSEIPMTSENVADKDLQDPEADLKTIVSRQDAVEEDIGCNVTKKFNSSDHSPSKSDDQIRDMHNEKVTQEKQTFADENIPVDCENGQSSSEIPPRSADMNGCLSEDSKLEEECDLFQKHENVVSEKLTKDLPKRVKSEPTSLQRKMQKGVVRKNGSMTGNKNKTHSASSSNYNPKQTDKSSAEVKLKEDLYKDTGGPIVGRVRSAQGHVMRSVVRAHRVMNTRRSKSVLGIASIKELTRDEQPSEGAESENKLTDKQTVWFMALWEQCVTNKKLDGVLPIMRNMPRPHRKQLTEVPGKVPLLLDATKLGNLQLVNFLIEECGADVEKTGMVHDTSFPFCDNAFSVSSLWYAAVAGHVDVVKTLIRHKASIHFRTSRGSTPLRSACFASQVETARLLLEAGAEVNSANFLGSTCLMNSVLCPELVRLLLAHGARPNDVDLGGNTALHYAAGEGVSESVQHIVQFGGDCLHKNRNGVSPLHRCAAEGWKDIVEYIVKSTSALKHAEVIEAYELLGCGYVDKFDSYDLALQQWENCLKLRDKHCPKLRVRKDRIAAFGRSLECMNLQELHAISSDRDEIRMQSLLVCERIYGQNNKEFINVLLSRAGMYFDTLKMFRRGMELFKLAFRLQATVHHPLSMIQMYTAQQITWLLLHSVQDSSRSPENWEQWVSTEDCLQVLASLVTILEKAKPAMREFLHRSQHPDSCVCSACDTGGILYPYNVKCACRRHTEKGRETYFLLIVFALHLVRMITTHMQLSPGQLHHFRSVVYKLVKNDHRSHTGESLLHLCFPLCDPWDTGRLSVPTMPLLKTLIVCGADADALDDFGESPMMYLFFSRGGWPQESLLSHPDKHRWVRLLVEHKAHVDRVSLLGNDLLKAVSEEQGRLEDEVVCIPSHVSLQCLAARAVRRHQVPYDDQESLPKHLIRFVSFH